MTSRHVHPDRTGSIEEGRFRGQPAITLAAGDLRATFLPGLGMTGVSLRWKGREHLAVPGGIPALRRGSTNGLPLLAPWANRLSAWRYEAAGVDVDLAGLRAAHGRTGAPDPRTPGRLTRLAGRSAVNRSGPGVVGCGGRCRRSGVPVRPPHRRDVHGARCRAAGHDDRHADRRSISARRVRLASLPAAARRAATRLASSRCRPPRTCSLDERGIPTGDEARQSTEAEPIGRRTFDDLYRLGRDRAFTVADEESAITMRAGCRLRLRPGVGAGRASVRRPGADGRAHRRAGRRIGTGRPAG